MKLMKDEEEEQHQLHYLGFSIHEFPDFLGFNLWSSTYFGIIFGWTMNPKNKKEKSGTKQTKIEKEKRSFACNFSFLVHGECFQDL